MIFCLMNLSILLVKFGPFKCIGGVCIQKLFILIKMMYSGIKRMVLCIAYHFRMSECFESRSHEEPAIYGARTDELPSVALAMLFAGYDL